MDKNRIIGTVILAAALSTVFVSCGGPSVTSESWLITVGGDTLTVGELGAAWSRLDPGNRQVFTEKQNTVGEYIVAYGRKTLLQMELEDAGYLSDDSLLALRNSWLMEKVINTYRELMFQDALERITPEEVDLYQNRVGDLAFFTVDHQGDSTSSYGPVHIPTLPRHMFGLLDSLPIGETGVTSEGMTMSLDSITKADSTLIQQAFSDTTSLRDGISRGLASGLFEKEKEALLESFASDYGLTVDSATVVLYANSLAPNGEPVEDSAVIMESDLDSWTVADLNEIVLYYDSRYNIDPSEMEIFYNLLENAHMNAYGRSMLEDEDPGLLDSLAEEADSYLIDIASEEFYRERISSTVSVTDEAMRDLFENMEEPMTVPEKRVLRAIMIPEDSMVVYRHTLPEEQHDYLMNMPGFPFVQADSTDPHLTEPLEVNQVPGGLGDDVFLIDPSDTSSWMGPMEAPGRSYHCMFKLVEVIPERNAEFEEVEDEIRVMTRNRLEEQATLDEMGELEHKYGMVINEEILQKLPEDPGLWSNL